MYFVFLITLGAALLIALGCIGIVYPVLPGSLAVLAGILLWSLTLRSPEGWWLLGLGAPIVLAGMMAQALLTGRTLKRRAIPNSSILWGVVGAVTGMFLIPVVGLFVGFALALFLSETTRSGGDLTTSLASTWAALKSMGLGMLIELAAALTAGSIFTVTAIIYFVTA
ncbi:DUF456 domain-containing protein [Rothia sp. P5766]|uniref:DUF456 domain-containing protein n=1 Tax=unclassified Rothia (in: high G+C Gram-positive bacteria) TaxID=2689056 RepID=UPI003AD73BBD